MRQNTIFYEEIHLIIIGFNFSLLNTDDRGASCCLHVIAQHSAQSTWRFCISDYICGQYFTHDREILLSVKHIYFHYFISIHQRFMYRDAKKIARDKLYENFSLNFPSHFFYCVMVHIQQTNASLFLKNFQFFSI